MSNEEKKTLAQMGLAVWSRMKFWSKVITLATGTATATASAILGIPPAWSALGFPEIATKWHVDKIVSPIKEAQALTKSVIDQIQIEQVKKDRSDLLRERFQWAAKMKELAPDSPSINDYQWRINQIDDDIRDRDRVIDRLTSARKN